MWNEFSSWLFSFLSPTFGWVQKHHSVLTDQSVIIYCYRNCLLVWLCYVRANILATFLDAFSYSQRGHFQSHMSCSLWVFFLLNTDHSIVLSWSYYLFIWTLDRQRLLFEEDFIFLGSQSGVSWAFSVVAFHIGGVISSTIFSVFQDLLVRDQVLILYFCFDSHTTDMKLIQLLDVFGC